MCLATGPFNPLQKPREARCYVEEEARLGEIETLIPDLTGCKIQNVEEEARLGEIETSKLFDGCIVFDFHVEEEARLGEIETLL